MIFTHVNKAVVLLNEENV